jgi:hypothetical protein
MDINE